MNFYQGGIFSLFMGSYWVKIDFEKVKVVVKITRNVTYTAKSKTNGTLGHTKLLYCNFEHVPTRILKQMIYHWKALI